MQKRMAAHNAGKGSKYVRANKPFDLVCVMGPTTRSYAAKLEYRLKKRTHFQKKEMVRLYNALDCWAKGKSGQNAKNAD